MLYPRSDGGLSAHPAPAPRSVSVWNLLGHADSARDTLTGAFAWVISEHCNPGADSFVPALGLDMESFARLLEKRFAHFSAPKSWLAAQQAKPCAANNEFFELLALLLEHLAANDDLHREISHLVAAACMGNDHLWQDLGLPDRRALSVLLNTYFPKLAARNTGDMKWKKFFYKQLCEREGINACKSPSCGQCSDHEQCFGAEQ